MSLFQDYLDADIILQGLSVSVRAVSEYRESYQLFQKKDSPLALSREILLSVFPLLFYFFSSLLSD